MGLCDRSGKAAAYAGFHALHEWRRRADLQHGYRVYVIDDTLQERICDE